MPSEHVMLVVSVPATHGDVLRKALGDAGAGKMGNYSHCSFTNSGTGRFMPRDGANPAIGQIDVMEEVSEERIEILCERDKMPAIIEALRKAHPYEEPAFHYYAVEIR